MKTIKYSKWFFILLSVSVSIWPALYNGFPLLTADSGKYISSGIRMSVPFDRPISYGVFILVSSLHISLWLVVFSQGIIFTLLIRWLCKKIFKEQLKESTLALIIILISFGTSAAWFNAQLMADVFSGMLIIALILLYLERDNKKKRNSLSLIILFFLLVHTSHILIVLVFCIITGISALRMKRKDFFLLSRRLLLLSIYSTLIVSTLNFIKFRTFSLSPASHMFMISRMVEEGLVDQYLEKECPVEHLSLCAFQGNLGNRQWDFMWGSQFPHNQEGGWTGSKSEYDKIIFGILKNPPLLGLFCLKTIEGTFRQLFQVYVGDGLSPEGVGSVPYLAVEKHFPYQIKDYENSAQMSQSLPIATFNKISIVLSLFVCVFTLFLWNTKKHSNIEREFLTQQDWKYIFQIVILFLLINAFVTATFSTVIGRLQSRVFWVLPTICLLWIIDYYKLNGKLRDL